LRKSHRGNRIGSITAKIVGSSVTNVYRYSVISGLKVLEMFPFNAAVAMGKNIWRRRIED
jgi:hypothetical protein